MSVFKTIVRKAFVAKGIKRITRQVAFPFLYINVKSDLTFIKERELFEGDLSTVNRVCYIRSDFWLKNNTLKTQGGFIYALPL